MAWLMKCQSILQCNGKGMNQCCHGPWHLVPHRGPLPEGVHKSHIVQHFLSSLTLISFPSLRKGITILFKERYQHLQEEIWGLSLFQVRCENNTGKELREAPGQPPPGKPVTLTHCRKGSKAKEESQNPSLVELGRDLWVHLLPPWPSPTSRWVWRPPSLWARAVCCAPG